MHTALALALTTTLLAVSPLAVAVDEPRFELSKQDGSFEVRRYAPYVVAEVRVGGGFTEAGNQGFKLLANYIFGGNKAQATLAMTAPVTQAAAEPVKLAMTAPVTQAARPEGGYIVQFVLPADVTLATAPVPNNPQVLVREEAARTVAVFRYSGSWSEQNYLDHLALLRLAADKAGLKLHGEPVLSRFNGPFSLPFMRRNEIWMTVSD